MKKLEKKNVAIIVSIFVVFLVLVILGFYFYSSGASFNKNSKVNDQEEAQVIDYDDMSTEKKEENLPKAAPDMSKEVPKFEGEMPEGAILPPPPKL